MSDATNVAAATRNAAQDAAATAAEDAPIAGLLDQAIKATKQTSENEATKLLRAFTEEALKGTLTYKKNVFQTINQAISAIDAKISSQLNAVMHHPKFQELEGTWRGLRYLVMNTETGTNLKL
jgi:type VI secretion system protein ImpC